jgi:hypothetical protein
MMRMMKMKKEMRTECYEVASSRFPLYCPLLRCGSLRVCVFVRNEQWSEVNEMSGVMSLYEVL